MLAWKNRNIPTAYSSWRETVQQVTMQMNGKHSQEKQDIDVTKQNVSPPFSSEQS
jgi:hypothetical protein